MHEMAYALIVQCVPVPTIDPLAIRLELSPLEFGAKEKKWSVSEPW